MAPSSHDPILVQILAQTQRTSDGVASLQTDVTHLKSKVDGLVKLGDRVIVLELAEKARRDAEQNEEDAAKATQQTQAANARDKRGHALELLKVALSSGLGFIVAKFSGH